MTVLLLVLTDGRRDCIIQTVAVAQKRLRGLPITRKVIIDDSGDRDYRTFLQDTFPGFGILSHGERHGYAKAMQLARRYASLGTEPWVFWLEDDWLISRNVQLDEMARVLTEHPYLQQMALVRNPVMAHEKEAGGFLAFRPEMYEDCTDGRASWLEQSTFWTMNPHLIAADKVDAYVWPDCPNSEVAYGRIVLRDGRKSAFWGARTDGAWCEHIGHERVGSGY